MRITEDKDVPFFGAWGNIDGALSLPLFNHGRGIPSKFLRDGPLGVLPFPDGDVLQAYFVEVVDANVRIPKTDPHFDDVDHEDEIDLLFGDGAPHQ